MVKMKPYPLEDLYKSFSSPPPKPTLLTLNGRYIGRGCGEVCYHVDGITRRFWVESIDVCMWHMSEFSRVQLQPSSLGQFHEENTYVIRWSYTVSYGRLHL